MICPTVRFGPKSVSPGTSESWCCQRVVYPRIAIPYYKESEGAHYVTEMHTDSCDDANCWVGCEERAGVAASGEATEAKLLRA